MITITATGLETAAEGVSKLSFTAEKQARAALKYAVSKSKGEASKFVRERYTAKAGDITRNLKTRINGLSGSLFSQGKRLGIDHFKTRPGGVIRRRGKYIFAQVVKGGGGTLQKGFRTPNRKLIFEREGTRRLPIKRVMSLSAEEMISYPTIADKILRGMEKRLAERLNM